MLDGQICLSDDSDTGSATDEAQGSVIGHWVMLPRVAERESEIVRSLHLLSFMFFLSCFMAG